MDLAGVSLGCGDEVVDLIQNQTAKAVGMADFGGVGNDNDRPLAAGRHQIVDGGLRVDRGSHADIGVDPVYTENAEVCYGAFDDIQRKSVAVCFGDSVVFAAGTYNAAVSAVR